MEQKTLDALKWMVNMLNSKGIDYQIAGGFAAKIYGSSRPLNDIDFDIHDGDFGKIINEVSPYITFGPARFKNEKWDCLLITLNYFGQEIDISGADTARISTLDMKKWIQYEKQDFDTVSFVVEGVDVKIMNPVELMRYKSELMDRDHQISDVAAVASYIEKSRFTPV